MRKITLIIFMLIMFFVSYFEVNASVNTTNTEIECVYANGVVIGMNYDKVAKQNSIYIRNYPVSNSVEVDFETITNISLYNENHAKSKLEKLTCPSHVFYWIVGELTNDGSYSYRGVYNFSTATSDSGVGGSSVTSELINPERSGWWIFSSVTFNNKMIPVIFKSKYNDATQSSCGNKYRQEYKDSKAYLCPCKGDCNTCLLNECNPEAKIPLVAERIYFVDDIGNDAYSHTYKLVNNDEQAVSVNKYAQFYTGTGRTFLQVGQNVTSASESLWPIPKYICVKESITTQDSNRGESAYKFSSTRHSITKQGDDKLSCGSGQQLYERTTETCKITVNGSNGPSFCDKYSNTAFVLIDIIKIMQVLVPAVVIVFTGIEIGRIVLAGNVEEELPKRKKNIVIRLIVMVAFFFLPIIVQLIVSLAEGVSILDVSCLFNDGQKVNETITEQNCVESNSGGTSGGSTLLPDNGVNNDTQVEIK